MIKRNNFLRLFACLLFVPSITFAQSIPSDPSESSDKSFKKYCSQTVKGLKAFEDRLSASQKMAFVQAIEDFRTNTQSLRIGYVQARRELNSTIYIDYVLNEDEAVVRNASANVASIVEELAVERAKLMASLYPEVFGQAEYKELVTLTAQLNLCLSSPKLAAQKRLVAWLEKQKS